MVVLQSLAGPIFRRSLSSVLSAQIQRDRDILNWLIVGIKGSAEASAVDHRRISGLTYEH